MRVKEGQHINKSLFFLTQVIALKAEGGRKQHIPFRNSPLTKILRSSLGGNSRTAIVLCITPSASQLEQTFSTLRFGQNAKMIRNTIIANVKANNNDQELRLILSEYERRLKDMENDSQQSSLKLR
jgi:Kinesin motor domain